ncbi:MAG: DUF3618 domain-containing protein [Candidatus Nanopelagicales bacterium]|nr:DUF3618 domain-containing protein [Candidatus Nanopelagicales bacterium]
MSDTAPPTTPPATADLQAEITAAREELVATISTLKGEMTPGAIARRGGRAITGWFTDEFGGIRPERVAIVGAVVAGIVVLKIIRRRG